jgi:hypothetical protein
MTPLQLLITALVRMLGLYFVMRALDNAAAPLFSMIMQASMVPNASGFQFPNPWIMFLPMVAFYIVVAAVIFFTAPRIARLMIGADDDREAEVPWHETLLVCTGGLIIAWAFVRLTDTVYGLGVSATRNGGQYSMDNAMMIYLFMTAVLLFAGFLLIAKFHRISAWITARRINSEQDGGGQPATRPEPK